MVKSGSVFCSLADKYANLGGFLLTSSSWILKLLSELGASNGRVLKFNAKTLKLWLQNLSRNKTNRDIPVHFVKGEALRLLRTNSSNKSLKENITTLKRQLRERGYLQNFINNTLSEVKFQERTESLPPTKQNKETNLTCRNTIHSSSSKSQRNLNEEVVANTATTIAKPNFQGAAHDIIQKGSFTQGHTLTSKIITKVKK